MSDLQLTLFDGPRRSKSRLERIEPSPGKTETSRAAAESIRGEESLRKREQILRAIQAAGEAGLTRDELVYRTGIPLQTVTGRVRELVLAGEIMDTDVRRATHSGRSAWVLRVCYRTNG